MSAKDSALLEFFHVSFLIQDKRRVISLPKWQDIILPNTRISAEKRLGNVRKRLDKNEALKMYYAQMVDYTANGQVEEAPLEDSTTVFYLPYQAVKKEKRGRTKWRIVFDASSHESNEPSLKMPWKWGQTSCPRFSRFYYGSHCITQLSSATLRKLYYNWSLMKITP